MAETVVECYNSTEGNLLAELADFMGKSWQTVKLSSDDIAELEKFLLIMTPMKNLFSSLNSDQDSNITRVFPTVLYLLGAVQEFAEDENCSAYEFAVELKKELTDTFGYVMDPKNKDFNAIFATATFLDPFFHSIVADDAALKDEVVKFLKNLVSSGSAEPSGARTSSSIKIKDYSFLKQQIKPSTISKATGSPFERDLTKYLEISLNYMERVQSEALANVAEDGNGNPGLKSIYIYVFFPSFE